MVYMGIIINLARDCVLWGLPPPKTDRRPPKETDIRNPAPLDSVRCTLSPHTHIGKGWK